MVNSVKGVHSFEAMHWRTKMNLAQVVTEVEYVKEKHPKSYS